MGVVIKINLPVYSREIAKVLCAAVAQDARNNASSIATKGVTGLLKASIQVQRINDFHYVVGSNLDYALAQEYGLAPYGKSNYTFNPYMRPAARIAESNIPALAKAAELSARRRARK